MIDDFLKLMDWRIAYPFTVQSVVVAVMPEHDCLKENVSQIDVRIIVHDLDNAARSICSEVGQRRDNVRTADLVSDILIQRFFLPAS